MSSPPQATSRPQLVPRERLESWKEIATYLNRGERTVQRWEREQGLPVHRLAHNKHSSVYAYAAELDAWRESRRLDENGEPEPDDTPPARIGGAKSRRLRLAILAPAVVLLGAVAVWLLRPEPSAPQWDIRPFTAFPGSELYPTFSPDGGRVAFAWDGDKGDNFDIYTMPAEGGTPTRLTTDPAMDVSPAWSPDGRWIAFIRMAPIGSQDALYIMPAIGGPERKIAPLYVLFATNLRSSPLLAWTRDGKHIAAGGQVTEPGRSSILLISVDNGETKTLVSPGAEPAYLITPSFSPDGKWLAYTRCRASVACSVFAVELTSSYALSGKPKELTYGHASANSPVWWPDGREEVLFSSGSAWETRALLAASVSGGRSGPREIHSAPDMEAITIAPNGKKLVYSRETFDADIWGLELPPNGGKPGAPAKKIASTRLDWSPDIAPDGSRVAFVSNRTGRPEVWLANPDGTNAEQLTKSGGLRASHPRWSPDGTRIAYMLFSTQGSAICIARPAGGAPDCITDGAQVDLEPSWSRDGRFIYFLSHRSGAMQLWRVALGGDRRPEQLTHQAGIGEGFESPDGKYVYFTTQEPCVWRVPAAGGKDERVARARGYQVIAAVREGLYLLGDQDLESARLAFMPYDAGDPVPLTRIDHPFGNMTASADGRTLLFARTERSESDLMLAEGIE